MTPGERLRRAADLLDAQRDAPAMTIIRLVRADLGKVLLTLKPKPTPLEPGWNGAAADVWFGAYGGSPLKPFFAALKPLVARHTWERVRPVLAFYLAQTASEYVSIPKFGAAFLAWEERSKGKPACLKLGPPVPF